MRARRCLRRRKDDVAGASGHVDPFKKGGLVTVVHFAEGSGISGDCCGDRVASVRPGAAPGQSIMTGLRVKMRGCTDTRK